MVKDTLEKYWGIERKSEIFNGLSIYYSGSIRGVNSNAERGYKLVRFMLENGANVLSAHVAARNKEEMRDIFSIMSGEGLENGKDTRTPEMCYRVDMGWVDEATHIVAVVDGASHGVGMEIMRALLKPSRGLNNTPILCLVKTENEDSVSWMIKGAYTEFGDAIKLKTYDADVEAEDLIKSFLLDNNNESKE